MKFNVSDETGDNVIEANSAREAAEKYVAGGTWGDRSETVWVDVYVTPREPLRIEYYDAHDKTIGTVTLAGTSQEDYDRWDQKLSNADEPYPKPDGWQGNWSNEMVAAHALIVQESRKEAITVTVDPDEPECEGGEEHAWQSPYELLGGNKENPGEFGHGGGVISTEVCSDCGRYRVTDTWAQRRDTGEQGLRSVAYRDADDKSRAWIQSLRK